MTKNSSKHHAPETSLSKAIKLLPIVAKRNAVGVNLSTVATKANLTNTTARRLLQGLVDGGLLSFDPYSKVYTLGIGLFDLAAAEGSPRGFDSVRLKLRPVLEEVAAITGETAYFSVLFGDEALCVDKVSGARTFHESTLQIGSRRPLGVGAGSTSILSALETNRCEQIIAMNDDVYPRYGDLTSSDVRKMVRHCRKHGYLINQSLIINGLSAVAVSVFGPGNRLVGGLSVTVPNENLGRARIKEIFNVMKSGVERSNWAIGQNDMLKSAREMK